jgi:hypothetical protein
MVAVNLFILLSLYTTWSRWNNECHFHDNIPMVGHAAKAGIDYIYYLEQL